MKLENIDLSFHYSDKEGNDRVIDATIDLEYGWQQWGQSRKILGENVHLLEEMAEVVMSNIS